MPRSTSIDLLVVDGPPAFEPGCGLARHRALVVLHDRLVAGATVVLDDVERAGEQEVLGRWEDEFGLAFRRVAAAGVAIATMPEVFAAGDVACRTGRIQVLSIGRQRSVVCAVSAADVPPATVRSGQAERGAVSFGSVVHVNEKGGSFGGTEEYIALLTAALGARGVRSSLVCGVVTGTLPVGLDEVRVIPGLAERRPRPGTAAAVAATIAELDPDVIYLHNVFDADVVPPSPHWPVAASCCGTSTTTT